MTLLRSRALFGACLLGALAWGGTASAQTADALPEPTGFDLRLFRPAVDSKGLFSVNGTDILGAGNFSFGFIGDLGAGLARIASVDGSSSPLVDTMISGTFQFNVGIANVLVVGAQVPFHLVSGPNNNEPMMGGGTPPRGGLGLLRSEYAPGTGGLDYQGLGDIVLHAKLRWLRGEYFPVGLAVILQAGIPVMPGTRNFAGEPGPWIWPSVALERRIGRSFRLALNLGFRLPFGTGAGLTPAQSVGGDRIEYGPSITWGLGASYRLASVVDITAETYGQQYVNGFGNVGAATPMEAVLGIKIFVERNSYLMLGAGPGFGGGLASANFRAFLGIIFEPSIGDTDGDGYRDDVDRCPTEPEDFDNFEDEEGCPEPDNDRDGILDTDDQCALVPEDRNGVQDTDGCPESEIADRDGDGIADNADRCADDPEDRDSFQDEEGCPDPDNDQDQILDTDDLCPNDPEDRDNFEDDNGCPDPDNDQDRILDTADTCPLVPEVYNGLNDTDGCPDEGSLIVIGNEVRLRDPILFETDSAQIVDNDQNRRILTELTELMNSRQDIELMEVEGHTDERADDNHNLQLSRDRANSVMAALVQRGIAQPRLVAAGYGEFCPEDPRHIPAAWDRNRRVVFKIIRITNRGRTTQAAGCPRGRQYIPETVGAPARAEDQP